MNEGDREKFTEFGIILRDVHEKLNRVYSRVFEDNGQSLISEVRTNRERIDIVCTSSAKSIRDIYLQIEKLNGKTGHKIFGRDTGDIWKLLIRLLTVISYIVLTVVGAKLTFF